MTLATPFVPEGPPRSVVCLQSFDLGGPVMETFGWPRHAWVVDCDRIDASKHYGLITLTRTYRCLRCGDEWSVSGEPAPGPRSW